MPRKTGQHPAQVPGMLAASMRPRPDAAENTRTVIRSPARGRTLQ